MSAENGTTAVVATAVSGVAAEIARDRAAAAGAQDDLPMFEVPTRHTGARAGELQRALEHRRSRGRPPGAVNRSTKAMREWLLSRGINPLQEMMRWALHTPTSLATEIGCTRLEAFDRLTALWEALSPYFASKMVPVDDQGRPVPFLQMNVGGMVIAPQAGAEAPWITALRQVEQNQALPAPQSDVSHGAVSHAGEKPA